MSGNESIIEVAPAGINDFNAILDLDESVYGFRTRGKLIAESILKNQCFKAVVNGKITGFIILNYTFYDNGFIDLIIVANSFRHMGIGSCLMKYIEKECTTDKIFTSTNQSNIPMQGLLTSCGYIKSGLIDNLDEGDPEVVYFKRLK